VRRVLHEGQVIAEFDISNPEEPSLQTKRSKNPRTHLSSKDKQSSEKNKVFDENYCGNVSEINNAFMMRLETSRKKIIGVIQILNFGSN